MTYNGWSNWETWNVILWLENDEDLWNNLRVKIKPYQRCGCVRDDIIYCVRSAYVYAFGAAITPDGVDLNDKSIDWQQIYEAVQEWFDLDVDPHCEEIYEEWENKDSFGREIT